MDKAEHFTEVTAFATANNSQSLLEDADDDVVGPAAASLGRNGKSRGAVLCARFRSLPQSERVCVFTVSSCVFHLSEPCRLTFDVQVACPLCPWRTVIRKGRQLEQHLEGDHAASLFLVAGGKKQLKMAMFFFEADTFTGRHPGRYLNRTPLPVENTLHTCWFAVNNFRGNCY